MCTQEYCLEVYAEGAGKESIPLVEYVYVYVGELKGSSRTGEENAGLLRLGCRK